MHTLLKILLPKSSTSPFEVTPVKFLDDDDSDEADLWKVKAFTSLGAVSTYNHK